MNTELSDEQLGRLWSQLNNRAPDHRPLEPYPPWRWVYDDGPIYALPYVVWEQIHTNRFDTEAEAYAAVGQALRELHRRAGEIAAVLEGVL